jgi:hypothetical protein
MKSTGLNNYKTTTRIHSSNTPKEVRISNLELLYNESEFKKTKNVMKQSNKNINFN